MPPEPVVPTPADAAPPAPTVPEPAAATALPRERFTMTVDQVAAELTHHGFRRDDRTIQRWCKSGRLTAILDHDQGDRYLIDATSLAAVIAALRQEEALRAPVPRPVAGYAPTPSPSYPDAATTPYGAPWPQPDMPRHDAAAAATHDAMPRPGRDDTAALTTRVAELERENVMLAADKQVREQMVSYLKEEFTKMLDHAMEATESLGQLRAENRYLTQANAELKALLPGPRPAAAARSEEGPRFAPRGVMRDGDFTTGPVHSEPDAPSWPGV